MQLDTADELLRRAEGGDRGAAGRWLEQNLPYLMGAARKIAPKLDAAGHEDMVQEAALRLLARWTEGAASGRAAGVDNPRGYLVASMRNAFIDELRSPRSRVRSFGSLDELSVPVGGEEHSGLAEPFAEQFAGHPELRVTDEEALRLVELEEERALVREALQRLNAGYRELLISAVVLGRKPAEIAAEEHRSAAAVSNSLARAKQALRRHTLILLLERGGPRCAEHAARLPDRVPVALEPHPVPPGDPSPMRAPQAEAIAHARACERCRSNWRAFAALASALGIMPLFAFGEWARGAGTLAGASSGVARGRESGGDAGTDAGPGNAVAGAATLQPGPAAVALRTLASPWAFAAGAAMLAGAAVLLGLDLFTEDPEPGGAGGRTLQRDLATVEQTAAGSGESREFSIRFEVGAQRGERADAASVDLDFAVLDAEMWAVEELRLVLPSGAALLEESSGWNCDGAGGDLVCLPLVPQPGPGSFELTGVGEYAEFSLAIEAVASDTSFDRSEAESESGQAGVSRILGRASGGF